MHITNKDLISQSCVPRVCGHVYTLLLAMVTPSTHIGRIECLVGKTSHRVLLMFS